MSHHSKGGFPSLDEVLPLSAAHLERFRCLVESALRVFAPTVVVTVRSGGVNGVYQVIVGGGAYGVKIVSRGTGFTGPVIEYLPWAINPAAMKEPRERYLAHDGRSFSAVRAVEALVQEVIKAFVQPVLENYEVAEALAAENEAEVAAAIQSGAPIYEQIADGETVERFAHHRFAQTADLQKAFASLGVGQEARCGQWTLRRTVIQAQG